MKYLLAVVVVVLGGLGLAAVIGDPPAEKDPAGPPRSEPQPPETGKAPTVAPAVPGAGAVASTSKESFNQRYKAPTDVLINGLEMIIKDLVTGEARVTDKNDVERRLILVLEEENLGDSFTRSETARSTIETMLKQMKRFMPPEGLKKTHVDPQMMAGIRQQAEQFALDIRRKESAGANRSQHEGNILSSIEFDAPKGFQKIRWDMIGGFEFRDHMKLPAEVTKLHGKKVAVAGYMITLGEVEDIHEFLLVESGWSCCFGIPPDVNQVIEVRIPKDQPGVEFTTTPVMVAGEMEVGEEVEDGFVISVYRVKPGTVVDVE